MQMGLPRQHAHTRMINWLGAHLRGRQASAYVNRCEVGLQGCGLPVLLNLVPSSPQEVDLPTKCKANVQRAHNTRLQGKCIKQEHNTL